MPVMLLDNRLCNGKPQAIAAGLPASGIVNPVKTFKNMFLVFYVYAFSCIVNQKPLFFGGLGKRYCYTAVYIGVLEGVV